MSNKFWFLENIDLFTKLCPHKFKEYKSCHTFLDFKKNDYVYFNQESANKMYLIQSGKIKLGYYTEDGAEVVKAILRKGELFGEKALLGQDKRCEFAQVVDNKTSVCPIDVDTLQDLMRKNQNLSLSIFKFINYRFKKLERRLEILLYKDVKVRVLEFLNDLVVDYGVKDEENNRIEIPHPYTQKDMASLLGTTRSTLNIILNDLKDQGTIEFDRKTIFLKENPEVLAS